MTRPNKHYWIYGKHSVISALKNPQRQKIELVLTEQSLKEVKTELDLDALKMEYRTTDMKEFHYLIGKEVIHQGIALKTFPLNGIFLSEFLDKVKHKTQSLVIALDQITDPQNMGAIMRTCAAFNVDSIIIPKNNSVSETPNVVKASSGAIDMLDIIYIANLSQTLEKLRSNGYWIIGLDGGADSSNTFNDAKKFDKLVLVLGSEGQGLRRLTKDNCDLMIKIDINSLIESLNVSTASAIAIYELKK